MDDAQPNIRRMLEAYYYNGGLDGLARALATPGHSLLPLVAEAAGAERRWVCVKGDPLCGWGAPNYRCSADCRYWWLLPAAPEEDG